MGSEMNSSTSLTICKVNDPTMVQLLSAGGLTEHIILRLLTICVYQSSLFSWKGDVLKQTTWSFQLSCPNLWTNQSGGQPKP